MTTTGYNGNSSYNGHHGNLVVVTVVAVVASLGQWGRQ